MSQYRVLLRDWQQERNVNFERILRLFLKFKGGFEKEVSTVEKIMGYLDKGFSV